MPCFDSIGELLLAYTSTKISHLPLFQFGRAPNDRNASSSRGFTWSLTVRPSKWTRPKGKDHLPVSSIFRGFALNFPGRKIPVNLANHPTFGITRNLHSLINSSSTPCVSGAILILVGVLHVMIFIFFQASKLKQNIRY